MTTLPITPGPLFSSRYGVDIALYAADERFDFEIQVANDSAGSPNLGTATTLPPVPGFTRVYTDERPNDGLTRWYRIRHIRDGYDPSPWTCWKSGVPKLTSGARERPDAVVPVIAVATTFDGVTCTLSITPDDTQCRVTKIEARTTTSAGVTSSWATLSPSSGVYTQTVAQGGPTGAKIEYRVTGYNEKGVNTVIEQKTYTFPAPGSTTSAGPNLDVRAVGGSMSWSIYWSGDGVTLDINGGGYGTPPSSPIVVTRPAAGAQDLVYTFKGYYNGQTATDSVLVPSIDKDTIPADLALTQGAMDGLTVPFTVSATRGDTGASIAVQTRVKGCTATNNGTGFSEADGWVTVAGTIVANRPAWGDVNGVIQFRTSPLTGVTAEEASRTVLRQEKVSFGPNLIVTPTPGPTSYSIEWSGDGVTLSVDGGTYGVPPSSPIVVTRNDVGGADKTYSFKGYLDQQTVVDSVTIPPKGAKDTPDLTVSQGAMTDTTIPFNVTYSAPGGSTVSCVAYLVDCTADISSGDSITSGQTITVNRPSFGSKAGSIRVVASISGGGKEEISRTVVTQIKVSFGPTLDVSFTESTTQVTINYNSPGATALEYSIDTGSHVDLLGGGTSGSLVVTRNGSGGAVKVVTIFATKDGQMIANSVNVNPQQPIGLKSARCRVDDLGSGSDDDYNVWWETTGSPSDSDYKIEIDMYRQPLTGQPFYYRGSYNGINPSDLAAVVTAPDGDGVSQKHYVVVTLYAVSDGKAIASVTTRPLPSTI